MAKIFTFFLFTILSIVLSLSFSSAIDDPLQYSTSSQTSPSPSSEINTSLDLTPVVSMSHILSDLGYHDFAMAARSLSISSKDSNRAGLHHPITIFAPADTSLRSCPSCSIHRLLQEHSIPGLYSSEYLRSLMFGTRIETIVPGRCLTVTSEFNTSRIFIGGAEVTRPDLYVSDTIIVHGVQGYFSHLSRYSCSVNRLKSLNLPHLSRNAALTRMMIADAMMRLQTRGYNILSLAMRVKYPDLVTFNNMTIFAVDDSTIFHGAQSYVHNVRYHIIPNQMLTFYDLQRFPVSTMFPTLNRGEFLTITTPGGGGVRNPMRINFVKIRNPNLIVNSKIVIHGIFSPFHHLQQSVGMLGEPIFYPMNSGEFGSDVRESTENTMGENTSPAPPTPVMQSTLQFNDDIHEGL